ncbi:MAG: hypothetical protein V3S97_07450 [Candidatus Bathyarchaeia archaeon]
MCPRGYIEKNAIALKECLRVVKSKGIVCIIELNKNGVEYCQNELGFIPDLIIPAHYIKPEEISIEVLTGKYTNTHMLKKR